VAQQPPRVRPSQEPADPEVPRSNEPFPHKPGVVLVPNPVGEPNARTLVAVEKQEGTRWQKSVRQMPHRGSWWRHTAAPCSEVGRVMSQRVRGMHSRARPQVAVMPATPPCRGSEL